MFTLDDFNKIYTYLKEVRKEDLGRPNDVDVASKALEDGLKSIARSEQAATKEFFETVIDQSVYALDDYKRLRDFLIDWYASLKTEITCARQASRLYALPNDHLTELFKSFGYTINLDVVPLENKVNFFLDLVSFYKKKGTSETISDVLTYYGFNDADILEYWVMKNKNSDLVLRPDRVTKRNSNLNIQLLEDISFTESIMVDPHWRQSPDDIEALLLQNKICLPSKSPYFSLSGSFSLNSLSGIAAIVSKIMVDQYAQFLSTNRLPGEISIKGIGFTVSLLELYCAINHAFDKYRFKWGTPMGVTKDLNHFQYVNDLDYSTIVPVSPIKLDEKYKLFDELISTRPTTRFERDTKIAEWMNTWTMPNSGYIFQYKDKSLDILEETRATGINPELLDVIDVWFAKADEKILLTNLLDAAHTWAKTNIATDIGNILIFVLGFTFLDEIKQIINFFKPYRARLLSFDSSFVIKSPLTDSIILEDQVNQDITQFVYDFDRVLKPGYDEDIDPKHDVGAADDDHFTYIDQYASDTNIVTDNVYTQVTDYYNELRLNFSDSLYQNIIQTTHDFPQQTQGESTYDVAPYYDPSVARDEYNLTIGIHFIDILRSRITTEEPWLDVDGNFDNLFSFDYAFITVYQESRDNLNITDSNLTNITLNFFEIGSGEYFDSGRDVDLSSVINVRDNVESSRIDVFSDTTRAKFDSTMWDVYTGYKILYKDSYGINWMSGGDVSFVEMDQSRIVQIDVQSGIFNFDEEPNFTFDFDREGNDECTIIINYH